MKLLSLSAGFLVAATLTSAHPGDDSLSPPLLAAASATPAGTILPSSQVTIRVEGNWRLIQANGLPDHVTGAFPNRNNPNRLTAQSYSFRVPAKPTAATQTTRLGMHPFGVAVNGVVFDPGAAEWWHGDRSSGWQYEPMAGAINLGVDASHGHVQPNGAYHYHAVPVALLDRLDHGRPQVVLLGWAADGFPIYGPWGPADPKQAAGALKKLVSSYRVKTGARPASADGPGERYDGTFVEDYEYVKGAGDLDECNGRTGVTPEFPDGTYYYVLTDNFPFIPRLFRGTPDRSFFRSGPPGGGPRRGGPGGGGPPPGPGGGPPPPFPPH